MTEEYQKRLEDLFHRAIEFTNAEQRAAFLETECEGNVALKVEVERLLEMSDRTDCLLDRAIADHSPKSWIDSTSTMDIGSQRPAYLKPSEYPGSLGRLGKYEVFEMIGQGGMGLIYRALAPELRREVAIKIQKPTAVVDAAKLARFKTEARAVAQLDHPNIVRIYDLEVDYDPPYIVMELVRGDDLAKLVKLNGPVFVRNAIRYGIDAARGLKAAHDAGIVHRDVKPQNLMLTKSGDVKVLDLGLARIPAGTECGPTDQINARYDSGVAGSLEFMSPEQTISLADATPRSDIYSLGCTLFWLVTGHPPYNAQNPIEAVHAHRGAQRPSILEYLPGDPVTKKLDSLLQRMMAIRPEDRPDGMATISTVLAEIIDEAAMDSRRRRRLAIISAGVFVIGLLLFSIVWNLLPPKYEFDFAAVSDLYEVRSLEKLVSEIDQVQAWRADYGNQGRAIARTILANPSETSFKSFLLSGGQGSIGDINKGLVKLDKTYNGVIPPAWRKAKAKDLELEIDKLLKKGLADDVRFRVGLLLNKPTSKSVLQRWGIADFPSAYYPDRQDRWIAALKKSLVEDIAPKAKWYERIQKTESIEFESASGVAVVLKLKPGETLFRGDQSTANCELWLRFDDGVLPANFTKEMDGRDPSTNEPQKQSVAIDTGIRLLECGLESGSDGSVQIRWPAPSGVVDHGKFANLLRYLRMPLAFDARDVRLVFDAQAKRPKLSVSFEFAHEDLSACRGKSEVVIDTASPQLLSYEPQAFSKAAQFLPGLLKELRSYRGFPVRFNPSDESGQFQCDFKAGDLPAFTLKAIFDEQFKLHFSGVPNVRTRHALAVAICEQSDSLKGMAAFCTIHSFQLNRSANALVGNMSFRFPGDNQDGISNRWSIDGAGKLTMVLSPEVREIVSRKHAELASLKKSSFDRAQIEVQVRNSLAKFAKLASQVDVGAISCSDIGAYFSLSLNIGDWPELRLGPFEVQSLAGIETAVKQALSSASIIDASNNQWQTDEKHPRFGRSIAKLLEWDSLKADGIIESTMLLTDDRFPLNVLERVHWEKGAVVLETQGGDGTSWVTSHEFAMSNRLKPSINSFCTLISNSIQDATGVRVRVGVDDKDLSEPWLRLSPPRVRLQGSVLVPLINTEFGFGRFEIGQEALSLPKVVMFQPRISIHTTHFTASDPSCEIDWERRSIQIGLKLTPPCPPLPFGSLSTGELSSYQASNLPLSDVRWDNLCLHAGHFGIRADVRSERVGAGGSNRMVFGAESDMVLLEDIRVAQGRGEISLRDWELEKLGLRVNGELNVISSKLGSLHANLQIVPNDNMSMTGQLEMAGFGLQGDMRYNSRSMPVMVDITARTRLEILRRSFETDIRGSSDLAFDKYSLSAGGSIPWPFTVERLFYKLTSDPYSTKLDWWWETPDGRTVHYVTEAPRIDLFDRDQLEQELMQVVARSIEPDVRRILSPVDLDDSATPQLAQESGTGESTIRESVEAKQVEVQQVSEPFENPSIAVVVEGDVMRVVSAELPKREYGRLTCEAAQVSSWENVLFGVGWSKDQVWVDILYPQSESRRGFIRCMRFKKDGTVETLETPAKLTEYAEKYDILTKKDLSVDHAMASWAIGQALKMDSDGFTSVDVTFSDSRFVVTGSGEGLAPLTYSFYRDADGRLQRITFFDFSGLDRMLALQDFGAGVKGITAGGNFGTFVLALRKENSGSRCAVMKRQSRDHFVLHLQTADAVEVHEVDRIDSVSPDQLLRMAKSLSQSLWESPANRGAPIYIGQVGACVVEEDGWRIMSRQTENEMDASEVNKISRNSFVNWSPTGIDALRSVDLLPQVLRDSKARKNVDAVRLAKQCVTGWQRLNVQSTSENRWHAHPMGLLLELAETEVTTSGSSEVK